MTFVISLSIVFTWIVGCDCYRKRLMTGFSFQDNKRGKTNGFHLETFLRKEKFDTTQLMVVGQRVTTLWP